MPASSIATPALLWDVFCRVIDNFGDIGVCWRLACNLAERGQRVRLWIDDTTALRWMAPDGHDGVEVAAWLAATSFPPPGDVVVEAFGCDPAPAFLAAMAAADRPPVWINLEYLSAEPYVERSHALASPQMSGPARGLAKWFFYPGFTAVTGGLLREPALSAEQAVFDRDAWLAAQGLGLRDGERLVSVFCYPGAPVDRLAASLAADGRPTLLATAPGAATGAVRAALATLGEPAALRQHPLPWLTQSGFDRLLWAADLNFVRGEDSWVRAQWAGRPFVWQAYPQDDGAHGPKIGAFLALSLATAAPDAAETIRDWTAAWNALDDPAAALPAWTPQALAATGAAARAWRDRLTGSADLVTRLLAFVREKR
ncbi:elongation factor P maturation arginine rhamnosyltransferase EarP [Scleromatobacter humisilvae]|uniref:Protein-arginine rhamnosyltransferase n=1 Tax=Scleromatobacter humisilvae TaxID=2897159 RepID=A0A9X1YL40_9BURK|nr:elongation factor P maturation arginine rhamnosyltransferase EarP [Scleromatobacter humisilvae]MCK9686728.1 elongation factor P maturation arginine rhamnosyltransferase EarP [Scleromatobacter humisilvae]